MKYLLLGALVGCSAAPITQQPEPDAQADVAVEASSPVNDASVPEVTTSDAADAGNACFVSSVGVYGTCITTSACAALGDNVSTPGYCPGPSGIECCTDAPDVADNPAVPSGWTLMQQSQVTPAMTSWAVSILHDPTTYPMWSTTTQVFGSQNVMARVEWHPPDFQNSVIHRGVTLYVPG